MLLVLFIFFLGLKSIFLSISYRYEYLHEYQKKRAVCIRPGCVSGCLGWIRIWIRIWKKVGSGSGFKKTRSGPEYLDLKHL